ncbi:MAG: hypothetical protein FWE13_01290 [Firmicutes bacterium]|nr:hypothetical protein [Bacillota bacterium]
MTTQNAQRKQILPFIIFQVAILLNMGVFIYFNIIYLPNVLPFLRSILMPFAFGLVVLLIGLPILIVISLFLNILLFIYIEKKNIYIILCNIPLFFCIFGSVFISFAFITTHIVPIIIFYIASITIFITFIVLLKTNSNTPPKIKENP